MYHWAICKYQILYNQTNFIMITQEQANQIQIGDCVEILHEHYFVITPITQAYEKKDIYSLKVDFLVKNDDGNVYKLFVFGKSYGRPILTDSALTNYLDDFLAEYRDDLREKMLNALAKNEEYWFFNFPSDLEYINKIVKASPIHTPEKIIIAKDDEWSKVKRFFFSDLEKEYVAPSNAPFKYI